MKLPMAVESEFAPFLPYCFAACYLAFLFERPAILELLLVTSAGAVLGLGLALLHLGSWIFGFGLAAACWAVLAPLVGRKSANPLVALLPFYPVIASTAMHTINHNSGITFDRYLLAADGAFGFHPGFAAARLVGSQSAVKWISDLCYFALPLAMASLFHTISSRRLMLVCGLVAVSSLAGYIAFPAVGAQIAFADLFPNHPPPANAIVAEPLFKPGGIARNFMPSLHTAWGIALLLAAWPLGNWWRLAILTYLGPMLLYTLARHYLCDMIVAVPWAFACWNIMEKRWEPAAAYLATAAGWMLLIRFALPVLYASPVIPWLLTALTVALPALVNFRCVYPRRAAALTGELSAADHATRSIAKNS